MRRIWYAGLAVTLAAALGACSNDRPAEPPTTAPVPAGQSPTPRSQIGTWTPLAELPQARTELSAAVLDGQVFVAGGLARGPGGERFYRYDPATDTWNELAPLPEARHHAPLAAHAGRVYVVGGFANRASREFPFGTPTDSLFVYDVAGDRWRLGPSLPEPVAAHAVATTEDGMIHVLGGVRDEPLSALDDHLVFDPDTGTWSTLPPLPTGREHLGATHLDGVIYTASGRLGLRGTEFEAYDVETQEWTVLPDVPTGRSGVAVVAFQDQVYVFGGEILGGRTFDHAEQFDPAAERWQEVAPMPSGRHGLGGAALPDEIMVIGGGPDPGLSHSVDTAIWRP